jgi:glutathione-specific gamma-glutamylcyclotransferase
LIVHSNGQPKGQVLVVAISGTRTMRLTPELVARCHRVISDPGPEPKYDYFSDDDYVTATEAVLAGKPDGPIWIFAYGSLIWKPEFPTAETRRAICHGWQRAFSMKIERFRGTPEQPGYMMCLDTGGICEGLALRLNNEDSSSQIHALLYREVGSHEALESIRWIDVQTAEGPLRALVSYARPHLLDFYADNRPLAEVARGMARACGHWGSCAEYLFNTVSHLETLGIHDDNLWKLQELVAQEIESA